MELFSRRCNVSPLILTLIFITFFHNVLSRHRIRHYKDRFKRQQGAHLYLPGSYVTDGGQGPDLGPWSEWSEPSPCSRTCGGGVSTQSRTCDAGYACQGPDKRHFSCNTQDCPDISDYRAQQCAEFNNIPFEGVYYQWVPYTKAPNPCELNCMPRGERFYFRHAPSVVDGTRCNDEKLDVCVEGRCHPVGCDMMLGSSAREDLCRVCGGDGSTCNTIENIFPMKDMQVGYNDILLIPSGATNIRVEETGPSNNYLAVRNTSGHYYLNGNWRIDFPRSIEFAGCKFHYDRNPQGFSAPDIITCLGPTDEPLFIVLLYQDSDVPVKYTYSLPTNVVPASESETYAWIFDEFTPCSTTCGGGLQYRNVTCAGRKTLEPVDRTLCNADNEPESQKRCNEIPCEAQWIPQPWEECSAPCGENGGTQKRKISCQQILGSGYPALADEAECLKHHPKPPDEQKCNVGKICAKWFTGPWKPCDHLCGDGKQTRNVTCYIKNKENKIEVLKDDECEAIEAKPEEERKCNIRPCEGVDWITSEWTGCDRICGLTNETRKAHCATAKGQVYPDELCEAEQKPEIIRKCDSSNATCEYLWYASQWSECSVECGQGIQTRTIFCGVLTVDGVKKVEKEKCDPSKHFETIKNCTGEEETCEGEWFSGPWGKCSKPCGGGLRTKKIVCLKDDMLVSPSLCGSDKIVFAQEECNTHPCSEDTIMPTDVTHSVDESEPGQDITTELPGTTDESEIPQSDVTDGFEVTTEITKPTQTLSEDDEYEIVADSKCDDGEWVEVEDQSADLKMDDPETQKSKPGSTELPLSVDDLMLSDGPYFTDDEGNTLEMGSGTGTTSLTTERGVPKSTEISESTDEEGSGTEPTIFGSDTEITFVTVDKSESSQLTTSIDNSDITTEIPRSTVSGISDITTEVSISVPSVSDTDLTTEASVSDITTDRSATSEATSQSSSSDFTSDISSSDITSDSPSSDLTTSTSDYGTTGSASSDVTTASTDVTISGSSDSSLSSESTTETDVTQESDTTEYTRTSEGIDTTPTDETTESTDTTESTSESTDTTESTNESDITATSIITESSGSESTTEVSSAQTSESELSTLSGTDSSETPTTEYEIFIGESNVGERKVIEGKSTETTETEETTEVSGSTQYASTTEITGSTLLPEATTDITGSTEQEGSTTEQTSGSDITTESPGSTTEFAGTTTETTPGGTREVTLTSTELTDISAVFTGTTDKVYSTTDGIETTTESVGSPKATTEFTGPTEITTEFTGPTQETTEFPTDNTTEPDIFATTTESGAPEETTYGTTPIIEIFKKSQKMCKRRKVKACRKAPYGCCWDNITPAEGPFDKGCPTPKTCKESKFGCCEDGVSPALGPNYAGCPTSHCNETLFGCCPDNKTAAEGNDNEGCPVPLPECAKSTYGCCKDNATEAKGPNQKGCEEEDKPVKETSTEQPSDGKETTETETEPSTTEGPVIREDCKNTTYRCCPDDVTPAEGPGFQGCNLPCSDSTFACCPDGVTAAHGPSGEGCCLSSAYGCCPDNILPARGPNLEGCGCQYSPYGCCPDNATYARGYNSEGCGCQYTEYGCCPDNFTPADGPEYEGCLCHTFQFGCCPDGITAARGPHQQGCGCKNTEFGCCSDDETPASGPNQEECGCVSSKFGCCVDGVTEAKGDNFEGCDTTPLNLQASCSLPKERGTCRNYTVKWFFDMDYGGCSRFWYGGCDGNGNRFKTKDECDRVCVEPKGPEICNLPKVAGPCEGYYPQWFYDKDFNHCAQFIYGGCLGNNNRFETRDECMQLCVKDRNVDACEQPKEEGPCQGTYERYYYDKESGQCQSFVYGGCKGNNNNFRTLEACQQKCTDPQRKKVKDICQLPAETGECANYVDRWYYDTREKVCRQFYYGGCGGNGNNFETQHKCQTRCEVKKPEPTAPTQLEPSQPTEPVIEPFRTDMCFLPNDSGPCRAFQVKYYYDRADGVCKFFQYGGCEGNRNRFNSVEECLQYCGASQDLCTLPPVVGRCDGAYLQYYYSPVSDTCLPFNFSGCEGNYNRFHDRSSCEQRCRKSPPVQVTQAPTAPPSDTLMCYQPPDSGNCSDYNVAFFYDKDSRKCSPFTYTGCGGNDNRFNSEEQCERHCGSFRGQDVCNMERDPGPCRGYFLKYYYDKPTGRCDQFAFGGCQGNGNRFSSIEECERICVSHIDPKPDNISRTAIPAVTEDSVHPCQEVFDECTNLRCPYGVEAYVDENECNRCQCRDPCKGVECLDDEKCAIDINRNKTSNLDADFIAICRESNKPGDCPSLQPSETDCEQECATDADCTLHLKCCSTGCGTACVDPTPPAQLVTQGPIEPAYTESPEESGPHAPKVDFEVYKPEVSALIGDEAILKCAVTGNPNPRIKWSKENIEIDGTQPRYRIKLDQSLQIITLHKTDSGIYLCTADNSIGDPITNQIRLDVVVPVRANITTNDQRYPVGSDIQIPCHVIGYPDPQVQWYKDNVPIYPSDRLQISDTYTLTILSAKRDDSGFYQCEATNAYSKASSTLELLIEGMYIHPSCKDNQFFANCALIVKAKYCTHKYYAKFCCRSCTEAGLLPVDGPHLSDYNKQNALNTNLV